jgi:PAS domain S-box-containing protein
MAASAERDVRSNLAFLDGGGEAGALIRGHDWAATPLGPFETWPQSLRSALSICLNSSFPTAIYWGPELRLLYNDAWSAIPAERHPWALGRAGAEVWADIWHVVGPQLAQVIASGDGFTTYDQLLPIMRDGVRRATFWNYSFTPIRGEDGSVAGVFNQGHETTDRVLRERRGRFLLALTDRLRGLSDPQAVIEAAQEALGRHLEANRVGYGEVDGSARYFTTARNWTDGSVPSREGTHDLAGFGPDVLAALRAGAPLVIQDAASDPRTAAPESLAAFEAIETRAVITASLVKDGRMRAALYVQARDPRPWSEVEAELVIEVAERTWGAVERALAEAQLRDNEARLRFLGELDEALVRSKDATGAMRAAAELLAKRLGASRCAYAAVDADNDSFVIHEDYTVPGLASSAGTYSLDLFGPRAAADMRAGRTLVIRDVSAELAPAGGQDMFQAIGIDAIVCCPLVKDGRLVAMMAVHQDRARDWRGDEIAMVESVVERCWAHVERVGAESRLRELNRTLEQRVAEALAERRLLADIVEGTDAFVQVLDLDFRWLAVNRAAADEFERVFGLRPKVGDNMIDLLAGQPEHQAAVKSLWSRALAGEEFTETAEFGDPARDRRSYEMKFNTLRDAEGRRIGAYQFVYDITERLRDQARLLEAQDALRQAQKMEAVGQLTGGVAHDFNNLLTIVKSSTDLLRRPGLSEERRRRYVDAISDTVDRASKLTGQLLAFARRQALKPEVFDAADRLRAVTDMLRTIVGARIEMRTEIDCEACVVEADVSQFETALVNMAVNARDAMDGEGRLIVKVEGVPSMPPIRGHAGAPGRFVALSLTDTGLGIPADHLTKIFEPFFTTKGVGKGTGLGLSQVFGFAKQSGGDVAVESVVGQGTTFTLYLPRVEGGGSADDAEARRAGGDVEGRGAHVLIVEDNVEVGRFSRQLLDDLGYRTTWAVNGEEALGLLAGEGFDVVFSDVVMPGMSGIELGLEIRRRHPGLPVVLTSGYSHVLAQEGTHGFELIHKPYAADEVSRVLQRVTGWKGRPG